VEESAETADLKSEREEDEGEAGGHDGGDGAAGEGECGGGEQRCDAAGEAKGHGAAVALEGALGADADGLYGANEDDEAGNAESGEAIGTEGGGSCDVAGHDGCEKPGDEGEDEPEDEVDPHGTADGAEESVGLAGPSQGSDLLDVGVAEPRGEDGSDTGDRCGDSPYAKASDTEMVKHDGGDQNHAHRISRVVENATQGVREMSLEYGPHL
jgi:hypothetical protein